MRIHFVTFATNAFRPRQCMLEASARHAGGADVIHTWSPRRLGKDGFLARHADLFPASKGYGWYAWKPYIIHQALLQAEDGDLIIYQDVGRKDPILITHRLEFWFRFLESTGRNCVPGVEIPWWGPNRNWTKRHAFRELGMEEPRYLDCSQVQASWSIWLACTKTRAFVREWSDLCKRRDLVDGELIEGKANEYPDFSEHRWDQSLLTLLTKRDDLKPITTIDNPIDGFNEKSCDDWMKRFGEPASFSLTTRLLKIASLAYSKVEIWPRRAGRIFLAKNQ